MNMYYIFIDPLFFYIIFLVILDNLLMLLIHFHVMRIWSYLHVFGAI